MPSVSEAQRRLFALANAVKKGKKVKAGSAAKKIAQTMAPEKINEFMTKAKS